MRACRSNTVVIFHPLSTHCTDAVAGPFQRSWEIFFQGQEAVARTARRKCLEHRLQAWSAPSIWNTAEVEQELRLKVLKRRERQNTLVADDARTPLDERQNTLVADISSCFRMPSFAKADAVLANSWAVKSATRHNESISLLSLSFPGARRRMGCEFSRDQVRQDQVRSGQIRSDQVRSDQVRSGQIRSGLVAVLRLG